MASRQKPNLDVRTLSRATRPSPSASTSGMKKRSVRSRMKNKEKGIKNENADLLTYPTSMQKEEKKGCSRTAIDCGFILDNLSCHARGTLSQLKVASHESVESV